MKERLEVLRGLPFPEQRALIEEAVGEGGFGATLLRATAGLPDHEPLALAARLLARERQLDAPEVAAALSAIFPDLEDTAIQRLLRTLVASQLPGEQVAVLVACVSRSLEALGTARIGATCLMDRWLKNAAPEEHRRLEARALAAVASVSSADAAEALSEAALLRLPGARLSSLASEPLWGSRLRRFAEEVLSVLEGAPKSLSQANAEEILSRQVYTDPGHFLVELLQNAEDASASQWTVEVGQRAISIWHDGADFDARDVVGLLSIGQSTKSKGQIGFFGVGFKSVYEICERPQVYSGLFNFEIADVSLPRRLDGRPEGHPPDGTLLVLPLRALDDPLRGPEALYESACAVPAETLLTLDNLRRLEARGPGRSRSVTRRPGSRPRREELLHEETSQVSAYLVTKDRFSYSGPRGAHRTASSPVLVAISLDDSGRPRPLPAAQPTLFSYLPTGEASGLRFMVHAHFDVTVDRERLDLDTAWNLWALSCAGDLVARCAEALIEEHVEGGTPESAGALTSLLRVIPLAEELGRSGYQVLLDRMRQRTRELPLLLGRGGELLRPEESALVLDDELADALAGVILTTDGRRGLARLEPREARVSLELGARPFEAEDLVLLLLRELTTPGDEAPPWLVEALPIILDALGRSDCDLSRLAELPIIPDQRGDLRRPAELWRAPVELRRLYGALRPFVAEALDLEGREGQRRLLDRLEVHEMTGADLVTDLERSPALRAELTRGARCWTLLEVLEELPARLTTSLGGLSLFPDERGRPGPLWPSAADGASHWLAPPGGLGELLRGLERRTLSFVAADLQERFGALLERLGGRLLSLDAAIEALSRGELLFDDGELSRLHEALEARRAELTPRLCEALAGSPIFPDVHGRRRPLRGPERALLPADDDLPALRPSAAWVAPEVASLVYVSRGLAVAPVGAVEVLRGLLLEVDEAEGGPLFDPFDDDQLRSAYDYLISHGEGAPRALIEAFAEAPLWLDDTGERRALAELSGQPASRALADLYRVWAVGRSIESGARSAGAVAVALGVADRVRPRDHSALITDLIGCGDAEELRRQTPLLVAALEEAAAELPDRALRQLVDAPIFCDDRGVHRPLRPWSSPDDGQRCARATGPLRGALALGSTPLLSLEEERALEAVLRKLDVGEAGVEDLVAALEHDPALAHDEARDAARDALARLAREVALSFTPPTRGAGHPRLQALCLWPMGDGGYGAAGEMIRPDELRALLPGQEGEIDLGGQKLAVLASSALGQADALRGLFVFQDLAEVVIGRLRARALVGEPLAAQPKALREVDHVAALLRVCFAHLGEVEATLSLPLVVDALGRLATGRHFQATAAELELAASLPEAPPLADRGWAEAASAIDPALSPRLPARRLLLALASTCREEVPIDRHPLLASSASRRLLYAWLLDRRHEIESDSEARGVLGRAPLIPTSAGVLRAPKTLLLDPSLPDLGLGWGVAEELPADLVVWLRETYQLEDQQVRQLVEYVVEGHRAAVDEEDLERSCELVQFLGRFLDLQAKGAATELAALARRFKLHRALKIASDGGGFERPGRLSLIAEERWRLIAAFHGNPPLLVSPRYGSAAQRALIVAAGAREDLALEPLKAMLSGGEWLRPGPTARVALALYLAHRAALEPSIKSALLLDRLPWIPNGLGELRRPADLFWPDEALRAILGDRPELYPDAEIFHAAPSAFGEALPFKRSLDVGLDQVILGIGQEHRAAPEAILDWLEGGLEAKRLSRQELRERLGQLTFLVDDRGGLRAPVDLVPASARELFGDRRGVWRDAIRWPRLASALRITGQGRVDQEVSRYLVEIAEELASRGSDVLLGQEPALASTLPSCLLRLADIEGKVTPPSPLPLACHSTTGAVELALSTDDRVALPRPEALVTLAGELGLDLLSPVCPPSGGEALPKLLRRLGLPDLRRRWSPLAIELRPEDRSGQIADARRLEATLGELWKLLPRIAPIPGRLGPPPSVVAAAEILVEGELNGLRGTASLPCAWDRRRQVIAVTAEALQELEEVAEVLWQEIFSSPPEVEEELLEIVTELLHLDEADQMEALLDGRGLTGTLERGPYRQRSGARRGGVEADGEPDAVDTSGNEPDETRGLFGRLRRWLRGGDDDEGPRSEPPPPPPRGQGRATTGARGRRGDGDRGDGSMPTAPQHARWFRPDDSQESQLRAAPAWLRDRQRPPEYGFVHLPGHLPLPWTYGVKLLSSRFDRRSQSWAPEVDDPSWATAAGGRAGEVRLKGQLPRGQVVLPLPLYGQIADLATSPEARRVQARDGRTMLITEARTEVTLAVELSRAPDFEGFEGPHREPPGALLTPTVPEGELPEEVLLFLDELEDSAGATLFEKAIAIRELIRTRYRYDPSYLEDDGVARWLREVSFRRPNVHIAALHAGGDGRHLGRGVCYDLNVLACELLRRAGVPAAIATGWTFSSGAVAEPDHLWAMALLPTALGWRWLPIDAATTRQGRPLQLPRRPSGPWRVKAPRSGASPEGSLELPEGDRPRRPGRRKRRPPGRVPTSGPRSARDRAHKVKAPERLPVTELLRLAQHLERVTDERLGDPASLRKRFELLLRDPERVEQLLKLLRGRD